MTRFTLKNTIFLSHLKTIQQGLLSWIWQPEISTITLTHLLTLNLKMLLMILSVLIQKVHLNSSVTGKFAPILPMSRSVISVVGK